MDKDDNKKIWQALNFEAARLSKISIAELFKLDVARLENFSLELEELFFDFSKNQIDAAALSLLCSLARTSRLQTSIEKLFSGCVVNHSEQRAATHTKIRAQLDLSHMASFLARINHNHFDTIVHLGVGGSDLGPRLLYTALQDFHNQHYQVHFVSEMDEAEINDVLAKINPHKTLFIVASKSFNTIETMQNAQRVKTFLAQYKVDFGKHMIAVTAEVQRAIDFGIDPKNILKFERTVGGRYSLWTAVSLVVALVIGIDNFSQFLRGAAMMDRHFQTAEFCYNMPVILALMSLWQLNFFNCDSRCIIPYSYRLRLLPDYLQQLHMESLGKSVCQDGSLAACKTGAIIWGKHATSSQHSFHQLLLQGNRRVAVDFVLPLKTHANSHNADMVSNCLSQSELLACGKQYEKNHYDVYGNKSHNILLLNKVTPYSLGALIALYEHKVFVLSVLWNINAFDQWGVEEGKRLARNPSDLLINKTLYKIALQEDSEVEYQ